MRGLLWCRSFLFALFPVLVSFLTQAICASVGPSAMISTRTAPVTTKKRRITYESASSPATVVCPSPLVVVMRPCLHSTSQVVLPLSRDVRREPVPPTFRLGASASVVLGVMLC